MPRSVYKIQNWSPALGFMSLWQLPQVLTYKLKYNFKKQKHTNTHQQYWRLFKLQVINANLLLTCSYYLATWLWPDTDSSDTLLMDNAESFEYGTRLMLSKSAQVEADHIIALWMWTVTDHEPHSWLMSQTQDLTVDSIAKKALTK